MTNAPISIGFFHSVCFDDLFDICCWLHNIPPCGCCVAFLTRKNKQDSFWASCPEKQWEAEVRLVTSRGGTSSRTFFFPHVEEAYHVSQGDKTWSLVVESTLENCRDLLLPRTYSWHLSGNLKAESRLKCIFRTVSHNCHEGTAWYRHLQVILKCLCECVYF